jgi:hypothetical protein
MKKKTNIIELSELGDLPCEEWLERFVDGKIDAHKAFKLYREEYKWLYKNSHYDLIGWEIENNCFDWKENSCYIAQFCPQYFDPNKYNWKYFSGEVAQYCPQYFDSKKFNWKYFSPAVAEYCPQHFDKDKYNWKNSTWAIKIYCPDLLKFKPQNI